MNFISTAGSIAHRIAAIGVCAVLVTAPFAYGGIEDWFRALAAAVLVGCCLISVVWLSTSGWGEEGCWPGGTRPSGFQDARGNGGAWGRPVSRMPLAAVLPVLILLGLAAVQLAAGLQDLDDLGGRFPLGTIYPAATRLAFASLISVLSAAVLGSLLFSTPPGFRGLLAVCLATGGAVAAAGLAMRLLGEDQIIRGLPVAGDPFATFVNRNNASGYLLVAVAAGLGFLRSVVRSPVDEEGGEFWGDPRFGDSGWRPDRATVLIGATVFLGLCLAGIVASKSRGGVIAAAVTLAAIPIFFRGTRLASFRIAVLVPVFVGIGLACWLGLATPVVERFRSLGAEGLLGEGRLPHWRDAARAMAARPISGAGLGTYGYAYQAFAQHPSEKRYEHADNQFVELGVEAGAVGMIALAVAVFVAGLAVIRSGAPPEARTTLAALVIGQMVHAMFDFAIVISATALTAAALWGAGLARIRGAVVPAAVPPLGAPGGWVNAIRSRGGIVFTLVVLAAGTGWAAWEHRGAWDVHRLASSDALRRRDVEATVLEEGLHSLERALARRPDDAEGQRAAAELGVSLYRTQASERLRNVDETLSEAVAWDLTGLADLHRALNAVSRSGASAGVEAARRDRVVAQWLAPARERYTRAVAACPGLPGTRLPLACLSFLGPESDPRGIPEIESAVHRFPAEPRVLRSAARLAWQGGESDLASRLWHSAFTLSGEGFAEVIAELTNSVNVVEAVRLTVPDDAVAALRLGRDPALSRLAGFWEVFGARLDEISRDVSPGALRLRLAANAAGFGRVEEAPARFQEAISAAPGDAELRAEHARFLLSVGRLAEGAAEMSVATALAPGRADFRQLADAWRRFPATRRQSERNGVRFRPNTLETEPEP